MPHPFAVQVCLVVWKDLIMYRLRRERLLSLLELSAPIVLFALFWLSFAAYPNTHRARLDAGPPGPRRDPCDAPYAASRLAFAPADSPYARELLLRAFPDLAQNRGLDGFASKQDILDEASNGTLGADVAVIFDGMEEASKVSSSEGLPNAPGDLNYTLLFGEALPPETFMFRCVGPRAIDDAQEELLASTLWPVQCRLNRAHLSLYAETRNIQPPPPVLKVRMKRFPLPSMETDVGSCQPLFPWVAMFLFEAGFLPLCLNYVSRIIAEKVNDKREWMMIQGLRNGAYLWGQGVAQFIAASIPCLVTMSVIVWPHHSVFFTALSYSEPTVLFTSLFLLYAAKVAATCLLFGTVFMNCWTCTHSFTLFWLFSATLGLMFELDTSATWVWVLSLVMPNLSLTIGLRNVWDAERQGVGLSWHRLDLLGDWPLAATSALSLLLLVTLVWYLDATLPYPDRMRRKPFQFVLQDEFWQMSPKAIDRYEAPDGHCCNPAGEPAVSVLDVRKQVGDVQINHLSIDFICNRITVIFGHSGSGKSTLVKMICGILSPDEGSIYVHDVNVQHRLSEARSLISYCAEKSTLFEFMTVKEHIEYSKMLNASSRTPAAWREVDTEDLLGRLRLSDYSDALISTLAVGVQRKVAVAVALSRPAEVLVLDEPTSGMDAVSQADVWKVLWLLRRTSTIIMTSNKSAEVDVLADRAVVLARGVVQLNNEVAYLRNNLGLGYRICLQMLPDTSSALIRKRLQSLRPEYRVLSEIGLEMMLYLPNTDQASARALALHLRGQKRALGLSHVGAPYRTIEDAVMRIWNRVHEPSYAASPSGDFGAEALCQHRQRPLHPSLSWSARRRFIALSVKNLRLFRAHLPKFGRGAVTCGVLFFVLHSTLVDRVTSLGAHADSGSLVKLDARSVGLGAFVRDWPASPVFAGVVLRSLLEESGVRHLLPLHDEPDEFLRSLSVSEWRRQGWGIELHAATAAPGASNWVTLWWSGERWASSGAALSMLHAAQLANVSRVAGARIRARAGALPGARWAASAQQILDRAFNDVHVFGAVLVLSVLLAPLTGSLGALACGEARSGLQLLQLMTGLSGCCYWLTHFVWDFIAPYLILFVPALTPAFLYYFLVRGGLFLVVSFALFLAYGLAVIPVVYLISKLTPFRCQVVVIFVSIVFGVVPTVLEIIWDAEGPGAAPIGRYITMAMRVFPSAALSSALTRILRLQALGQLCDLPSQHRIGLCTQLQRLLFSQTALESLAVCCPDGIDKPVPSWADLLLGDRHFVTDVSALLLVSAAALLLLVLSGSVLAPIWHFVTHGASRSLWRPSGPGREPLGPGEASGLMSPASPPPARRPPSRANTSAVSFLRTANRSTERTQIKAKKVALLEATDLCRTFGSLVAVRGLSLRVHEGQCVGLLGQSGAGKSTTLRMLSGELQPTAGSRVVNAPDSEAATLIGYQPSIAGCSPELTARQHLRLLAALRLVPDAENLVSHLLRLMDLEREADTPTEHYCRASLRKLGLAMALLGAPRLVLLDAPTSGVDPISARKMWQALDAFVVANNQAVVLATTLIPECLALCSETLVLSQGELTWSGPVPELRNTFFMGMVITVTLADEEEPAVLARFQKRVREIFQGEAHMVTMHKNVVRFKIGDPLYPLASLKAKMNEVFELNVVRQVDFGHVALHKLFGIKEPE